MAGIHFQEKNIFLHFSLHYFYFQWSGPQDVMVTLSCHDNAADMDLYGSYDNPEPYYLSSSFASYSSGDEHIGLVMSSSGTINSTSINT